MGFFLLGGVGRSFCQLVQEWAEREAPIMRCVLVHALNLTKRTPRAKSYVIRALKDFIVKVLQDGGKWGCQIVKLKDFFSLHTHVLCLQAYRHLVFKWWHEITPIFN